MTPTYVSFISGQIIEPEVPRWINQEFKIQRRKDSLVFNIFSDAKEGLSFIQNHITKKQIVVTDYSPFHPGKATPWKNGKEAVLKKIRRFSSKIPVIFWDSTPDSMYTSEIGELVNLGLFGFVKRHDVLGLIQTILNASSENNRDLSAIIEDYALIHYPNLFTTGNETHKWADIGVKHGTPYISKGGKDYRLDKIVAEIRKETPLGKSFELEITNITLELLKRNTEKLTSKAK